MDLMDTLEKGKCTEMATIKLYEAIHWFQSAVVNQKLKTLDAEK